MFLVNTVGFLAGNILTVTEIGMFSLIAAVHFKKPFTNSL